MLLPDPASALEDEQIEALSPREEVEMHPMTSDTDRDVFEGADRGDGDTPIGCIGLWIVRIAAVPFLIVGIAAWAAIVGLAALVHAVARVLGTLSARRDAVGAMASAPYTAPRTPAEGMCGPGPR